MEAGSEARLFASSFIHSGVYSRSWEELEMSISDKFVGMQLNEGAGRDTEPEASQQKSKLQQKSTGEWSSNHSNNANTDGWGSDKKNTDAGKDGWGSAPSAASGGWGVTGNNGPSNREPYTDTLHHGDRSDKGRHAGEPADEATVTKVVDGLIESLQNVEVKLADKQADVNSPLYSVKAFEELGLSEALLKGIYAMKYIKPSKVQERALPLLLCDPPMNMIAQSQSGTGKTAAFVLTMLNRVDPSLEVSQAICLAPTRELARQIVDVARKMGQFTNVTIAMCLREEAPRNEQIKAHVLVGTPGTLLEMERRRIIDLSKIRVFVLDEADVMLDKQGMGLQSMRLCKLCPAEDLQLLLFSATFNEAVMNFAHMIVPNANEITLKREEVSVDSIKQYYIQCDSYRHKIETLSALYGLLTIGQSIVFIATRDSAEEIKLRMESEGHLVSLIHGGMLPAERDRVIDEFRQGRTKVLLSTNVLARGIDVLQVSLVVNFDLPMTPEKLPDPETYVHRIGRTGRFGRKGVAINFVHNRLSEEILHALEEFFGREIIKIPSESFELMEHKLQEISNA